MVDRPGESAFRRLGDGSTLGRVQILAGLPVVTAVLAVVCTVVPAARRLVWPVVALAAVNIMLTPLTSGEWFYQRTEDASYEQAVATGDFTAFDRLSAGHDPHLFPRMVGIAVALLVALIGWGLLQRRGDKPAAATRAAVAGLVVAAAVVSIAQGLVVLV
jgi:hypothetical protein